MAVPDAAPERKPLDRLLVPDGDELLAIEMERVDWIESDGNQVRLHVGPRQFRLRATLRDLEERVDSRTFLRIHRSTMVNVERIRALRPLEHGDLMVVLEDGEELRLARGRKSDLSERFGGAL